MRTTNYFRVLIAVTFCLGYQLITAQTLPTNTEFYKQKESEINIEEFNGSKYLNDDFTSVSVYDGLSDLSFNTFARYDVLNDVFEIKKDPNKKSYEFLKKTPATAVQMDNDKFTYTSYVNNLGKRENGYLQELGSVSDKKIFARNYAELRLPEKAKTTLEKDRKGKVFLKVYYLLENQNSLAPIDIDKKSILTLFDKSKQSKVKTFMKAQKLKARTIQEIRDIITYAASL